ncbi:hypothetical protein BDY24DRAFT_85608 [Mrakia frigida]|uniref:uncharacterized protein n=1 Tax=Mrakia frigida TaxID=29902 RepID=UPI003FCC1916
MLISSILPRLVGSLLRHCSFSPNQQLAASLLSPPSFTNLSPYYLQQASYHYSPSASSVSGHSPSFFWSANSLEGLVELGVKVGNNIVPLFNLLFALAVFFYLVDEPTFTRLISGCSSSTTTPLNLYSHRFPSGDFKSTSSGVVDPSLKDEKSTLVRDRSRWIILVLEQTVLLTVLISVMLSMIFVSNSVFDSFAANLSPNTDLTLLLPLAAHFASFTLLVLFLLSSLLFILLSNLFGPCEDHEDDIQPLLPLHPLIFLLSSVLFLSTGLSRFPLGIVTLSQPSKSIMENVDLAHVALLVLEPGALMLMAGWISWSADRVLKR